MVTFDDLPVELQGRCARLLDTTSAGRFGKASKADAAECLAAQAAALVSVKTVCTQRADGPAVDVATCQRFVKSLSADLCHPKK